MGVPVLLEPGSSHQAKSLAQSARLIVGGLLSRPAVTSGAAGCNALQPHCGPGSSCPATLGTGAQIVWLLCTA
jgi:hypothetical protein